MQRRASTPGPVSPLQAHNLAVLQESNISHVNLPPMFITWRHFNHERSMAKGLTFEQAHVAVCLTAEKVGGAVHPLWRFTLMEHPLHIVGRTQIELTPDRWCSGQTHRIIVQRPSPQADRNNKLFVTEISHSGYAVRLSAQQLLPILKLSSPNLVLDARFCNVDGRYFSEIGFVCKLGQAIAPPPETAALPRRVLAPVPLLPPPVVPATPPRPTVVPANVVRVAMPQHIVNTVIETLVAQEAECPILRTTLSKETTSLTPCGHALTTTAAIRWIQQSRSCPECRAPCTVEQLQAWRV